MEDNKTKEEILREALDKEATGNSGVVMIEKSAIYEIMEVYTQQSTKQLQDRVKELEKEARQMIYKFMLSDEMANRPDGEHIIETIEKWFLNTKS